MKQHFGLLMVIGVLLSFWFSSPLAAQDKERLQPGLAMNVSDVSLEIFSETNPSSSRLSDVEPGELVDVLLVDEEWAQIETDGAQGWARYSTPGGYSLVNVSGPTPRPRGYHQLAYDVESDRVILFSGLLPGSINFLNETWAYEVGTNTWTNMTPAQSPPAGEGPLAYDVQSDRVIWLFGSNDMFTNATTETWVYDFNTNTWMNAEPTVSPPPVLGARMVYDSESDRMILFGGIDVTRIPDKIQFLNETWAYDYDTNTWTKMEPALSPPGMNYHNMAYDAGADRVVLLPMGYSYPGSGLNDNTWVYDHNTGMWEVRETTEGPARRDYSAMVYAAGINRLVLFGAGEPTTQDDTWTYDFDTHTWTELHPDEHPGQRGWHAMVYSSLADRIILFGGGPDRDSYSLETWLYDPNTETWTNASP